MRKKDEYGDWIPEKDPGPFISEDEFAADLAQGLSELSAAICRANLPISTIARETGLHWGTVSNAASGIQVRFDAARRLAYYLRHLNENQQQK